MTKDIEDRLDRTEKNIDKCSENIKELSNTVADFGGQVKIMTGLITDHVKTDQADHKTMHELIRKNENVIMKYKWIATGMAIIVGAIFSIIKWLI